MSLHSGFTLVDDDDIIPETADTSNLGSSSKTFLAVYMKQALLYSDDASFPVMKLDHTGGEWHKGAIQFLDSGVRRWQAQHIGQDLKFLRYDSGGSYQDDPLVLKEGGNVEVANDLLVDEIKEKTSDAGVSFGSVVDFGHAVTREVKTLLDGDYTITDDDPDVFFLTEPQTVDRTITLPTAADNKGRILHFVAKQGASGKTTNWILDGEGSETINGAATYTLSGHDHDRVTIACDGSNWFVLAE